MFGLEDQSQTMSEAVTPFPEWYNIGDEDPTPFPLLVPLQFPCMAAGSVFILFTYTPRNSSVNVATSQLGLFGGDFGLGCVNRKKFENKLVKKIHIIYLIVYLIM